MKKILSLVLMSLLLFSMPFQGSAEAAQPKKLDEKTKIALVYFTKNITEISFSRKEIISGRYIQKLMTGDQIKKSKNFEVIQLQYKLEGAPKNMKFYSPRISFSHFQTIIGVSDTTIMYIGTQSGGTYQSFAKAGNTYKMKDYLKYTKTKEFKEIYNKIKFVNHK